MSPHSKKKASLFLNGNLQLSDHINHLTSSQPEPTFKVRSPDEEIWLSGLCSKNAQSQSTVVVLAEIVALQTAKGRKEWKTLRFFLVLFLFS